MEYQSKSCTSMLGVVAILSILLGCSAEPLGAYLTNLGQRQLVAADLSDSNCDAFLSSIVDSIIQKQIPQLPGQTLQYSGKGLNDIGNEMLCTASPGFRFFVLKLRAGATELDIGLCMPDVCTEADLKQYEQPTVEAINGIYQKEYVNQAIYQDPSQVYPPFNAGAWVVSFIAGGVVLLNLMGSTLTFIDNRKKVDDASTAKVGTPFTRTQIKQGDTSPSLSQDEAQVVQGQTFSYQDNSPSEGASADNLYSLATEAQRVIRKPRESTSLKVLKCFSFTENLSKLFRVKQEDAGNSFQIFNGVRALSIFWVIYGHDYLVRFKLASNTADIMTMVETTGWVTLAPSAYFAVDVFFFIGGFLAAVLVLEKILKLKRIRPMLIPSMWLHRFLRIWPTLAFCLLVWYKLSVYWFSGPLWGLYVEQTSFCEGTFWRNLLFIDNMFSHGNNGMSYCFGWGWYLANDFQIFLITPPLLVIYAKNPKIGNYLLAAIFLGSISLAYGMAWANDYHVSMPSPNGSAMPDYQDHFYYKPWIRISPYIMGIAYGLMYRQYKNGLNGWYTSLALKVHSSYAWQAALYVIGIGLTMMVVWMIVPLQKDMDAWPKQIQYLYQSLNRVFFVAGVALCLTPALIGVKHDPARAILGHAMWVPIARISFCMYLVQMIVIFFSTYGSSQIHYFQNSHMLFFILVDIVYSMLLGGLLSLMVEVPFMNLEKILFARPPSLKDTAVAEREREE